MKTKINIVAILFICLFLHSCEGVWIEPDPKNDPVANFEHLWSDVKSRYSYFELKAIDWDSIYSVFRPKVTSDTDDKKLFKILGDMLYELRDGHVNLTSTFDRSRNWNWYLDYEPNFNETIVERNYLRKTHFITGPLKNQLIDSVLYVYYASFGDKISNGNLNELVGRASGLKGVIVDVRSNGGGSLSNAWLLASCFAQDKVVYARERVKIGPKENDFSQWSDMILKPKDGKRFEGPVVLLCNRQCYSAASFFAQMMRTLPNVTLIGDQTGGGGGVPASGEMLNGWRYRMSVTQTVTPDGIHIEPGVPVDVKISLDPADERKGKDTMIEKALEIILSGHSD